MKREAPSKARILIVEDEMIIAADLSIQLSALNYEVIGIQTRAENALKTIEENCPDLVLMDIILAGEMNGIQAAAHILKTSKIPVIFLAGSNQEFYLQRAIKNKPFAFIEKPFRKSNLKRCIESALNQKTEKSSSLKVL